MFHSETRELLKLWERAGRLELAVIRERERINPRSGGRTYRRSLPTSLQLRNEFFNGIDAMTFFDPEIIRLLDRDLRRPDSLITHCLADMHGQGRGIARLIAFEGGPRGEERRLLDLLTFRDVLLEHDSLYNYQSIFLTAYTTVGMGNEESLAQDGAERFGWDRIVDAVNTSAAMNKFRWMCGLLVAPFTSGPEGYLDNDIWHSKTQIMTADFATWLLSAPRTSMDIADAIASGPPTSLGIVPFDFDRAALTHVLDRGRARIGGRAT